MSESDQITNRSEIVFVYDVREANPNGDPLAENRPRIDEETGMCFVTDVRLKRTVRDYLKTYENQVILVADYEKDDGTIKMGKERAADLGVTPDSTDGAKTLTGQCIDVRLFGCALPLGEGSRSLQITGPVQFNYGRSVHEVEPVLVQGTAAFASRPDSLNRSFRTDYLVHYALFKFYGIVNENLAAITGLTKTDLALLMKGLWKGTERLQSRSKFGHFPRLLIRIEYKEKDFFIGQIDKLVQVTKKDPAQAGQAVRDVSEFNFSLDPLCSILMAHKDKIESIDLCVDRDVSIMGDSLDTLKNAFTVTELAW
jgi:CRISPR-associated protein Csh2